MSGLVLKLGPHERVLINGAVIENGDRRSRLSIMSPNANILRMRDAIAPGQATTPVRRVCYIAQLVLSGDMEQAEARMQLLRGIEQLSQVLTDSDSRQLLAMATRAVTEDAPYQVLKALRSLLPREERLFAARPPMTFAVTLPVTGYAGWNFLKRTQARQQAALAADPVQKREETYFRNRIGTVTRVEELVADKRLLRVALGAFGLQEDIGKTYFISRVLQDGTAESDDLANRLSDKRYAQLADAFGFDDGTPATTADGFADMIVSNYRQQKYEEAVGTADSSLRSALFAERQIPKIAQKSSSERTKWFSVVGSEALSDVFVAAFSLSGSFSALDVDLQVTVLQKKTRQMFGDSSLSQFTDAAKLEKLMRLYLIKTQTAESAKAGSSGANALTILQSGAGYLSRI